MTTLPADFISQTKALFGDALWADFLHAMEEEPPVSIRLNPLKTKGWEVAEGEAMPWCRGGYYLSQRPPFTFDPLLHAGAYYVQEASSMFLDEVLRQFAGNPDSGFKFQVSSALDLCAAPGGKSTVLRSALTEECILVSNEPNGKRAQILAENIQKWGAPNSMVTNNYPRDFRKAKTQFDLILVDAPCSGEGMFRKDEGSIREWSKANVEKCWRLQREILEDAWQCLRPGGLLIYSTCTFNIQENEENVRWMMEALGAEVLPIETQKEWNITGSLLPGFTEPVYRFIPGRTRGEGLFMAVVRKGTHPLSLPKGGNSISLKGLKVLYPTQEATKIPPLGREDMGRVPLGGVSVPLTYPQALQYLRREALVLPDDVPKGIVTVTFQGLPLGQVKNLGTRANNLYPKEWRIKSTHIPTEYETIFRYP